MNKSITAQIIADSINNKGDRITSFVLTFPRIILAEVNTHRMFSRNSASSRAVPFNKMVKQCLQDPFIPIAFQKDHKGMQGTQYLQGQQQQAARWAWDLASKRAIDSAKILHGDISIENDLEDPVDIKTTKQLCNRLLEPFIWHTAIVTATEFENFFALRCPKYELLDEQMPITFRSRKDLLNHVKSVEADQFKDQYDNMSTVDWLKINKGAGEIHIMELAEQMWDRYNESKPQKLLPGQWHIPFGDKIDQDRLNSLAEKIEDEQQIIHSIQLQDLMIKIATARCARVSYINYQGKDDYEADIKLHDRLASMGHWSPFEHCAQPMSQSKCSGNFKGFTQYRKMFENENIE